MNYALPLSLTVLAYLIGSLSFAVIISRAMGLHDPRSYGSKNPGATNVLRSGNKAAAVITLLLDVLKGWLPVFLVQFFGADYGLREGTVAAVGFAAFIGHLYPIFFRFQGGKGVATAAGVLIGISPFLGLATLATFGIVVFFTRYVSLASIVAAVFAPFYYLLGGGVAWTIEAPIGMAIFAISAGLVWRHRDNLERLVKGQESRLGAKKSPVVAPSAKTSKK